MKVQFIQNYNYIRPCKVQKTKKASEPKVIFFTGKNNASPELKEVVEIADKLSAKNLQKHLEFLAGPETEGRGVGEKGIDLAKDYIAARFEEYGLQPVKELGLDSYFEDFIMPKFKIKSLERGEHTEGRIINLARKPKKTKASNVLGMIKGSKKPDEYIMISAHYDHIGKDPETGLVFPGADDNATGIACLLEVARIMSGQTPEKSIIFAALSGEESGQKGSHKLSEDMIDKGMASQVEVFNIDMVGGSGGSKLDVWNYHSQQALKMLEQVSKAGKDLNIKVETHENEDPANEPKTDATKFNQQKIPAITAAWDYTIEEKEGEDKIPVYHQAYHSSDDVTSSVNSKVFYEAARVIAAASYLMANDK